MAYKYEQIVVRMRWIDYVRIRHVFPKEVDESTADYFRRLALKLKELKGGFTENGTSN